MIPKLSPYCAITFVCLDEGLRVCLDQPVLTPPKRRWNAWNRERQVTLVAVGCLSNRIDSERSHPDRKFCKRKDRGRIRPRVVNRVQEARTAYLVRELHQLIGAGSGSSYAGGPRGYGCTWDDVGLTGWTVYERCRARPQQEPRDTAMA